MSCYTCSILYIVLEDVHYANTSYQQTSIRERSDWCEAQSILDRKKENC